MDITTNTIDDTNHVLNNDCDKQEIQIMDSKVVDDEPVLKKSDIELNVIDKQIDSLNIEPTSHIKSNENGIIDGEVTNGHKPQEGTINEEEDTTTDQSNVDQTVPQTPKATRKRRSVAELTNTPTDNTNNNNNESEQNSEHRLTRSRYGRLQKAKTPNPEMITFEVKRRSSLKNSSDTPVVSSPVKADDNRRRSKRNEEKDSKSSELTSEESTLRKSKRRISVSPRESPRKKKSNKLDSVIDQIKGKPNDNNTKTLTPSQTSVKKQTNNTNKQLINQKKCIELTGDSSATIVNRSVLLTIPQQEGDYCVGDLIWAKVSGYPWWPCMISLDPIYALYSKISGAGIKSGRIYHVQYFGPQALRGWTSIGQVMPFEGRDSYLLKLETLKESSPKAQSAKIAAKYAIKPSLKKQWDQSVDEAEEAAKMDRDSRVRSLTFDYILTSKTNLRRKSDGLSDGEFNLKRKKHNSSPEDVYDFDDDEASVNVLQTTPGLMWRKRVQKGDFAIYVERHYKSMETENPDANRKEIEDMLKRRWDLLGEDLRALYTDRKYTAITHSTENITQNQTPKSETTPKSTVSSKSKTKDNRKLKQTLNKSIEYESDSEGNLVISETPIKRSTKSITKSDDNNVNCFSKKDLNSVKSQEIKGSQKKKSPKVVKKSPTKLSKSSVEENGVFEKSCSQITDQSLVHFGIDYLDEFASSEDTSSTSEPEAVDGVKSGFDKFCVICNDSEGSDTLIACQGNCFQMFHKKCINYEGIDNQYKCSECETGKHKCYVCKSDEMKEEKCPQKCNDMKCGKYYHLSCLEKGFPVKMNDTKDSFVCPLHFCLNCHIESQNDKQFRPSRRRLVKCISCPTAYHLGDYCIAAGTVQVSQNYVICPDHFEKRKKDRHVNVNYCFSCLTGGQLVCCESCPAAFHQNCLDYNVDPDSNFYCTDCTARKPLHYGDIVWVKLGFYRWWPGKVCHPKQVPDNVMKLPHGVGEFPVYFFGSHDYYWVHRGRVFLFMEGDNKVVAANSGGKKSSNSILKTFKLATEEAAENFKIWQESKIAFRQAMVINKPPPYQHIRSNKGVGPKVQIANTDESQISLCECKVKNDISCSDDTCINRALMVECDPKLCHSGDKCKNQRFKKREYALTKPFKTILSAGWGLRTLEDIKKGQFVIEYVGELIDEDECERRLKEMATNNESNFYFLTIDKDNIIDAGPKGNLARFMNHSCQPNCETQKWMVNGATRVGLFAVCDISAGTELTFNYNLDCRGNEKTKCVCGSANCSGFIGVRPKVEENHNKKNASNGQNSKKKKKKNETSKKDFSRMHDDDCFSCGEGGDLVMCDRKGCPKSYHLECLKLQTIPKGKWECPRHFCDTCGKAATALCEFCPNSLCKEHAIPSKLTQLPDGGLVCSDHSTDDIDGCIIKQKTDDIEMMRNESISDIHEDNNTEVKLELSNSLLENIDSLTKSEN
ncbi:histone-lysine N-methyltransferase NSD2-like [Oppia nitens]|uniref:histone-lysine N-methyltransferase NSD2-like n=1 Tax=Oppia nitens TaxID=1686743 RepID=UPI0023DB958B|nr:histone-lysine N-methyltransferase NSD2-like [Oppia nitens]